MTVGNFAHNALISLYYTCKTRISVYNTFNTRISVYYTLDVRTSVHLCFNITEKGQMIVPDLYNMILEYTITYGKNYFSNEIGMKI